MGGSLSQNRKSSVGSSPGKQSSTSESEETFDTPEAESPAVVNLLSQLENCNLTDGPDVTNHSLDQCPKKDSEALNNLTNTSLIISNLSLDQNLNLTLSPKPNQGNGISPPTPRAQVLRPPSLSVISALDKPDPTEVDDEAPVTPDSSPDSNFIPGHDTNVDPDLLNGNTNPEKLICEADNTIITNPCKVSQKQLIETKMHGQDDHRGSYTTDEEKLASSAGGGHFTSKPEEPDCCSAYEDTCKLQNKARGSEMQKTGSQVLDSICISEAEKHAVLTIIKKEIISKESEVSDWKKKYEDCRQEVIEMRKIVAEYEKTIAQMIEDEQRNNASSQKALHAVTLEKEAAVADLNSVERSLSDVFRRYENMKTTIDGFKKNEEVLKKCAQDYLARVKQEEHRYQTLKLYAEEKLDKANEEIAQVRAKASAENMALTAGLRKEQIKNESLEQALQQKNQEMEELTKICNELIARMGKVD